MFWGSTREALLCPLPAVAEPVPADEEYADQHLDHDGGPEPGGGGLGDVHAHDGEGDEGEGHPQEAPGQVSGVVDPRGSHVEAQDVAGEDVDGAGDEGQGQFPACAHLAEGRRLGVLLKDAVRRVFSQLPAQPVGQGDHHRRPQHIHGDGRRKGEENAAGREEDAAENEDAEALQREEEEHEQDGQQGIPGGVMEYAVHGKLVPVHKTDRQDHQPDAQQDDLICSGVQDVTAALFCHRFLLCRGGPGGPPL